MNSKKFIGLGIGEIGIIRPISKDKMERLRLKPPQSLKKLDIAYINYLFKENEQTENDIIFGTFLINK